MHRRAAAYAHIAPTHEYASPVSADSSAYIYALADLYFFSHTHFWTDNLCPSEDELCAESSGGFPGHRLML